MVKSHVFLLFLIVLSALNIQGISSAKRKYHGHGHHYRPGKPGGTPGQSSGGKPLVTPGGGGSNIGGSGNGMTTCSQRRLATRSRLYCDHIMAENRVPCGPNAEGQGISVNTCLEHGCCFEDNQKRGIRVQCFYPMFDVKDELKEKKRKLKRI